MRNSTIRFILLLLAAAALVTLFALRFNRETSTPSVPTVVSAGHEFQRLRISDLHGQYVLVNFWDSRNAVSRIASAEYDLWVKHHPSKDVTLVQVNTDDDRALWSEIVNHDRFDPATQFHLTSAEVRGIEAESYRPADGHSSYLIAPDGKIVARNPSVEALNSIIPNGSLAKR